MRTETRILDFSGVYPDAGFPEALANLGIGFERIGLRHIEGTSCYCDAEAASAIRAALAGCGPEGLHWIDSGDYHYVTRFFLEKIRRPYTLVLLDNHTDRQEPAFPGVLSCGSWVKDVMETDGNLQGVVSIGPLPEAERLGAPDPGGPVYVSLDKDILSPTYARTDWSQGAYTLPQIFGILSGVFSEASEIIGMDVCGARSVSKGASREDLFLNCRTDIEIQRFIMNYFNF